MKSFFLILSLLSFPCLGFSQIYEVLEAKNITKPDGERVRRGSFLLKTDTILIAEKGYLTLDVESAMHMKLPPGNYSVGAESARHNKWYNTHLELTKELKRKGMIMCHFTYKTLAVPGSNRHYEIDRIELDQNGLVNADTAALTITWAWIIRA